jgi:ubiquinone biosynthesis protein UbiJ
MFLKIEGLINHALSLDAKAADCLKKLQGKLLEIKITTFLKPIHLSFTEKGIHFVKENTSAPEVIVSGPLKAFINLAFSKNPLKAAQFGLRFEGDLSTAEIIQTLFLSLDIDWEEALSHLTGDTVAYQIGRFVKRARQWQKETFKNFQEDTHLYLTEEIKWLISQPEATNFMADVDNLRSEIDRLEARIALLSQSKSSEKNTFRENDV